MNCKILVVEDDNQIQELIVEFLSSQDYVVDTANDGVEGYEKFKEGEYDLEILDVMMPRLDGHSLCKMIRSMAKKLDVKIFGIVENMSYIECPDCNKKIKLFDGEETDKFLKEMDLDLLGELPMTREIVEITHKGVDTISEELDVILNNIVEKIENKISK